MHCIAMMSLPDSPPAAPVTVPVPLGSRAYDIIIAPGLLRDAGRQLAPLASTGRVIILADRALQPTHLPPLRNSLAAAGLRVDTVLMNATEEHKNFISLQEILDQLLDLKADRKTLLLALGGGVVGDMAGFAASILLRGVPFVQVPTTLLAQVDSSVGGKTGLNTRQGKNLVGSFCQPRRVLIDPGTLATLPRRQVMAGYAEILKYALIDNRTFFEWLATGNGAAVLDLAPQALTHALATSCRSKAALVVADEHETGVRALLNLGHTFGHAIEAVAGYDNTVLHGEAVALGCLMAFDLSVRLGLCPPDDLRAVTTHQAQLGFATRLSALAPHKHWSPAALLAAMDHDKKTSAGRKMFVLARGIGQAFVARDVDDTPVLATLEALL
jgi:3-dehydroquinate synthase